MMYLIVLFALAWIMMIIGVIIAVFEYRKTGSVYGRSPQESTIFLLLYGLILCMMWFFV
jgi:hypothetical protein